MTLETELNNSHLKPVNEAIEAVISARQALPENVRKVFNW